MHIEPLECRRHFAANPSATVNIPDPALAAEIRTTLHLTAGPITRDQLLQLKTFHPESSDIHNLAGLDQAINLTDLSFYSPDLTDLSPLSSLTQLTKLYIQSPSLVDISPLASLTSLKTLSVSSDALTDLTPLSNLPQLSLLDLAYNPKLADLTPLHSLTSLKTLNLNDTAVSNLAALSGLPKLTSLYARDNNLTDLNPLAHVPNLRTLYVPNSNVTDISPLAGLKHLIDLDLSHNSISSIASLAGKPTLKTVDLRHNSILFVPGANAVRVLHALRAGHTLVDAEAQIVGPQIVPLRNGYPFVLPYPPADLGKLLPGQTSAPYTFGISNYGDRPLKILSITAPPEIQITQRPDSSIDAGTNSTFAVQVKVDSPQAYLGDILITSNDALNSPLKIPIMALVGITPAEAAAKPLGTYSGVFFNHAREIYVGKNLSHGFHGSIRITKWTGNRAQFIMVSGDYHETSEYSRRGNQIIEGGDGSSHHYFDAYVLGDHLVGAYGNTRVFDGWFSLKRIHPRA